MAIKSTQKAKLSLRAQELALTKDVKDDYYLTVKLQKCLSLKEIAEEVAAMSTRQEEAEEVERITRRSMEVMEWFLSSGYSISTPMGYFRPTVSGVMLESELAGSPNRDRLSLVRELLHERGDAPSPCRCRAGRGDTEGCRRPANLPGAPHSGRAEPGCRDPRRGNGHCRRRELRHQGQEAESGWHGREHRRDTDPSGRLVERDLLLPALETLSQHRHASGLHHARFGCGRFGVERYAVYPTWSYKRTAEGAAHGDDGRLFCGRQDGIHAVGRRQYRW